MLKVSDILSKEVCKSLFSLNELSSYKGKSYYNGIVLKELFTTFGLDFTKSDVEDIISKTIPSTLFYTKKEEEINNNLLVDKLLRYVRYENSLPTKRSELNKAGQTILNFGGNEIKVDYHLILYNNFVGSDAISVIKVKNKKCNLKKGGYSELTKISKNMELFLLQKVGEKLYPGKKIYGTIVFLSHPEDTSAGLSFKFEESANQNLATYHFDEVESKELEDRLLTLCTSNDKTCSQTVCNICSYSNICNYVHTDMTAYKVIPTKAKAGTVKFTEAQEEFINFEEGNCRVLAGAGSGKTTVIANRIVKLIEKGVSEKEILLITYTTKGVEELKEKISYWLKFYGLTQKAEDFNIFTFNSFGYELIKKEYSSLGFTDIPAVLDRITKIELIKGLLDTVPQIEGLNYLYPFMDLYNAKGAVIRVASYFDIIKSNSLLYPDEVMDFCSIQTEATAITILKLYNEYANLLKTLNLIDFSDQIQLAYQILSDKSNLKKYAYEHIIVDEFQDSDNEQINLLKLLDNYSYKKSLVVVGDDAQSIFSFRGANQSNIVEFNKFFDDVMDISLEENFRSTDEICQLANEINGINLSRVDKKLVSSNTGVAPKLLFKTKSNQEEVVNSIVEKLSEGVQANEICVISRSKKELLDIQKELTKLDIPSIVDVSELLIDNDKVKNIIGYSKFFLDNTLDLHFAEYLQVVKNEEFNKVFNKAEFADFVKEEKAKFLAKFSLCADNAEQVNFFYQTLEVVAKTDNAVEKLIQICKDKGFASMNEVSFFLNNLITYKSDYFVEKPKSVFDAVVLTTAHSSKGKEFENVYLLVDKFSYPRRLDATTVNLPKTEEERRLVFVGMTRAKKDLTIVGSKTNSVITEVLSAFNNLGFKA